MNKDNAKDYLPLVQALVDGKTIQIDALLNGDWKDPIGDDGFSFRLPPEYYRIKPEPMSLWAWYNRNGFRMFVGELKGAAAWRERNSDPSYYMKQFIEVT